MAIEIIKNKGLLEDFVKKEKFDKTTKEKIVNADLVILPNNGFRNEEGRLFPSEMPMFLKYLRENVKDKEIMVAEEEGKEKLLQLRDYTITLPIINVTIDLVKDVGLPFFISLITGYILSKFPREAKQNKIKTNFDLKIEQTKTKKSVTLHYDGDYEGIEKSFKQIDINKLFNEK